MITPFSTLHPIKKSNVHKITQCENLVQTSKRALTPRTSEPMWYSSFLKGFNSSPHSCAHIINRAAWKRDTCVVPWKCRCVIKKLTTRAFSYLLTCNFRCRKYLNTFFLCYCLQLVRFHCIHYVKSRIVKLTTTFSVVTDVKLKRFSHDYIVLSITGSHDYTP